MLETIREYAGERLEESGEAEEIRRRHADHFTALAEEADAMMGSDHQHAQIWSSRLETEHDNLRAAFDRLIASADGEAAQRLSGSLWKFWYMTGAIGEGRRRLEAALSFETPRTVIRARALDGATSTSIETGDEALARVYAEESLAINEELGDPFGIAHAQFLLANVVASEGDWMDARMLLEQCRARFLELRAEYYTLLSTRVLAWCCAELGDRATARALNEENLRDARAAGNTRIEGMTLGALAYGAIDDGRFREAAPLARDSYWIKRSEGDRLQVASALFTIARLLAKTGRAVSATRVLSRSTALYEEMDAAIPSYDLVDREETVDEIRRSLSESEYEDAWESGRRLGDSEIDAILEEVVADEAVEPDA